MRIALPSVLLVAACAYACSTFSDAEESTSTPTTDAGTDDSAAPPACVPVIVDPASPQECAAELATDPLNCGTCGHACVDSPCLEGLCVAEQITPEERSVFAVEGRSLYVVAGGDVQRVDLTKRPSVLEPFFTGVLGEVKRMEAYAGELYVSTTQLPSIIRISDKQQRGNEHFTSVNTERGDGTFFPGRVAYYVYPAGDVGGSVLARIDTSTGSVRKKNQTGFLPAARSGDELFWTESLTVGAQIWGAWDEEKEPIVRVGSAVLGFAAEGNTVFLAAGGFVVRAERGQITNLAQEPGTGLAAAVSGDDLFYLVRRDLTGESRHRLYRVDKCSGGRPVLLHETVNSEVTSFAIEDDAHLLVSTASGIVRVRR